MDVDDDILESPPSEILESYPRESMTIIVVRSVILASLLTGGAWLLIEFVFTRFPVG